MPKNSRSTRKKTGLKKTPKPKTRNLEDQLKKELIQSASQEPAEKPRLRGLKRLNWRAWRDNRREHIQKQAALPGVVYLSRTAWTTVWRYRNVFIGLVLTYGLLNLFFVQGVASSSDISSLKSEFGKVAAGHFGGLVSGLTIFTILIGTNSSGSNQSAASYQLFLLIVVSLATIWTLRQSLSGVRIRVRDAFYKGASPLVPFILVLLVIAIQLVPLAIGASLYTLVLNNGIALNFTEKFIWGLIFGVLAFVSLYFVSSSLFAAYIVTLPDMTPMKALRSARELVRYRRWTILRKVLFLPLLLLIVTAIIMVPVISVVTPLAQWVFFILMMAAIAVVHSYMYTLYRELLHE